MDTYKNIIVNRVQFIRSLGIDIADVVEDGVTDDGVIVVGEHPDGQIRFPRENSVITSLIPYPDDATRERALAACMADWYASGSILTTTEGQGNG